MLYDVGVLTILNPTSLVLEMASPSELQAMTPDTPLTCLGIPNGFDPNATAGHSGSNPSAASWRCSSPPPPAAHPYYT